MNIWILQINHKHGENISAHTTEKLGKDELYAYIQDNWDDGLEEQYDFLDNLTDEQATEHYFDCHDHCLDPETYVLEMVSLNTSHSSNWAWSERIDEIDYMELELFMVQQITSEPLTPPRLVRNYHHATSEQRDAMDSVLVSLSGWTMTNLLEQSQPDDD